MLDFGFNRVVIATGARWRADGVGHLNVRPIPISKSTEVLTPDDLMKDARPSGKRVLIWDDEHYYMAGVLAELLSCEGYEIEFATPAAEVSAWTRATLEQRFIQRRLMERGITIRPHRGLAAVTESGVVLRCVFTGKEERLEADSVVLVTARLPEEALACELHARQPEWTKAGVESVRVIGDALAPATIAHAVYAGRRYAEELDEAPTDEDALPFRRELAELSPL